MLQGTAIRWTARKVVAHGLAAGQMPSSDSGAWQVATFRMETDADVHADHWEMHPRAEEAACCLTGGIRLYFRPSHLEGTQPTTPGRNSFRCRC